MSRRSCYYGSEFYYPHSYNLTLTLNTSRDNLMYQTFPAMVSCPVATFSHLSRGVIHKSCQVLFEKKKREP